ncbi:MAG TPA: PEP-CTERM sorting domain-containing protein [Pirellulales bacterium]
MILTTARFFQNRTARLCVFILSLLILGGARLACGQSVDDDANPYPLLGDEAAGSGAAVAGAATVPLTLNSRLGAPYTIYLDFGGFTFTGNWGNNALYSPGTTPAYTVDGDATTFNATELANIKIMWSRIAEKYSSFNVNVTTVDPAVLAGQAGSDLLRQSFYDATPKLMHTVIGGTGSWTSGGGISYIGVTANSQAGTNGYHTDWVFAAQAPTNLQAISEAGAHENGHGFDLWHQSVYNGNTLSNEYDPGNSAKAPTMGNSYSSARGLWRNGPAHVGSNVGPTNQNDVTTILNLGINPGIAIADDGVGHSMGTATALPLSGTNVDFNNAFGVITPSSRTVVANGLANYTADFWSFSVNSALGLLNLTANAGRETITPGTADPGATLDSSLLILNSQGNVVASSITSNLSESISTSLPAGSYFAEVQSAADPANDGYYDIGSYFLTGSIIAVPEPATWLLLAIGATLVVSARRRLSAI